MFKYIVPALLSVFNYISVHKIKISDYQNISLSTDDQIITKYLPQNVTKHFKNALFPHMKQWLFSKIFCT